MRLPFWLSGVLALGIAVLFSNEPFFWDTIQLGARHADLFYTQPFGTLLLPDDMDSGHIPTFGWYLAICWRVFGQSLQVSHLAMFPFIWLVLWQAYHLGMSIANNTNYSIKVSLATATQGQENQKEASNIRLGYILALMLLLDATLVAQLSLISPDIVLAGAFLLGINSIRQQQKNWLAIAVVLLGLISLRGMMVAFGLFLWQCYLFILANKSSITFRKIWQILLPYLPGGLVALAYLSYHYYSKGWVGTHVDSPWAASFSSKEGVSLLRQTAIVGWRMLDYGHVFLFVALALSWWRSHWVWNKEIKASLALLFLMAGILSLPAIVSPGLAQHRYFLPVYLSLTFLFLLILAPLKAGFWKNAIIAIVLIGQISGHFWIYPTGIAQGWDASLTHKPYFAAKEAGFQFLKERDIQLSEVGTIFPEIGPQHLRLLNGDTSGMVFLDLSQQSYVWYSNVMNDFSEEEMLTLQEDWMEIFSYQKRGIHLKIYQKE